MYMLCTEQVSCTLSAAKGFTITITITRTFNPAAD